MIELLCYISTLGCIVAVVFGTSSAIWMTAAIDIQDNVRQFGGLAGLVIAMGGLVTAIGTQVVAFLRVYGEQRARDRAAKWERHDLANKVSAVILQMAAMEQEKTGANAREKMGDTKMAAVEKEPRRIRGSEEDVK
jgi:uncharacterized membrane protein YcjF (UPF0283 family)